MALPLPQRPPNSAYKLQLLTLGAYFFYWCARSGSEVNASLGKQEVPTAWWFLVPFFGGYWWLWLYSKALHDATTGRVKSSDTFLLYIVATHAFVIIPFISLNLSGSGLSAKLILILVLIGVAIFWLAEIIGHAFFIAQVQSKINKAVAGSPPVPIPPSPLQ